MIEKARLFFSEAGQELRKVTWPSRKEILASSAVVLVVAILFMILIGIEDWTITKFMDLILQ